MYELNLKYREFDSFGDGQMTWWYENGQIEAQATYQDGECISGDCDFFNDM